MKYSFFPFVEKKYALIWRTIEFLQQISFTTEKNWYLIFNLWLCITCHVERFFLSRNQWTTSFLSVHLTVSNLCHQKVHLQHTVVRLGISVFSKGSFTLILLLPFLARLPRSHSQLLTFLKSLQIIATYIIEKSKLLSEEQRKNWEYYRLIAKCRKSS